MQNKKYYSTNTTTINRVNKSKNYTTINNICLRDKRLSWKAKGIMAYMLTLPDTWIINIGEVITHSPDGEKGFRSGLKELKDHGYVVRVQIRDEKRIVGWHTEINEIPEDFNEDNQVKFDVNLDAEKLHVEKVDVEKLHVEKDVLLITKDINNLKELNTKDNIKDNVTSVPSASKVKYENEIKIVVDHYNQSMGTRKGYTEKTLVKDLTKIFKEGYTTENVKDVLNYKIHEWINNKEMKKHLVPGTLFRFSNFEKYLDQVMLANQPSNIYEQKKYQQPQQQVTSKEVIKSQPDHNGFDGTNLNEDMLLKGIDKDTLLTYYNIQLNVTGKQFVYDRKPMTYQEFKNFIEFI